MPPAGVPERNDLKRYGADSAIDKIPYPPKVQPANNICTWNFNAGADARLFSQQGQGGFQVFTHCTWRGRPVQRPPLCGLFYLPQRAGFDAYGERQDQPKRFRRANSSCADTPLFQLGLIQSLQQFRLVSRCQTRSILVIPGQHRDDGSLGQGKPFDNDLPSTTVPVASCMDQWYFKARQSARHRPASPLTWQPAPCTPRSRRTRCPPSAHRTSWSAPCRCWGW